MANRVNPVDLYHMQVTYPRPESQVQFSRPPITHLHSSSEHLRDVNTIGNFHTYVFFPFVRPSISTEGWIREAAYHTYRKSSLCFPLPQRRQLIVSLPDRHRRPEICPEWSAVHILGRGNVHPESLTHRNACAVGRKTGGLGVSHSFLLLPVHIQF